MWQFALLFLATLATSVPVPFIQNITLVSISSSNSTMLYNSSCDNCLCLSINTIAVLNCFDNKTCQLFFTVPLRYELQSTPQARLYFPNLQLPSSSQCCMHNLTSLLNKLQNAIPTFLNVTGPRCLVLDNHGYLVTVETSPFYLDRINVTTMTVTNRTLRSATGTKTLGFNYGAYYIGLASNTIQVIDSHSLSLLTTIAPPGMNNPRDVIVVGNGLTMVAASTGNNYLFFYKRSNTTSANYTYAYKQLINCPSPHGLTFVNDSFFYVTSWANNCIYSYEMANNTAWTERLVVNGQSVTSVSNGYHVTLDECGRFWFSMGTFGVQIFDKQGVLLGNFTYPSISFFDTILTSNYVMYVSDNDGNKIIRFDPNIQC